MKKIYILLFICFMSTFIFAQSNLQYNQAKLISANDTVPVGKVWKVEGVIYSSQVAAFVLYNQTITDNIFINSNEVSIRKSSMTTAPYTSSATSIIWEQKFPLWFPAGTTLAPSTGVLYINVVEFNTVQ